MTEVDKYDYLGVYLRKLWIYNRLRKRVNSIKKLNNEPLSDENLYIYKDALQNFYQFGIKNGKERLISEFNSCICDIIKWLDRFKEPYRIIYNTHYEYNTYNNVYGKYKEWGTGINEVTHSFAKEYAMNKIFKK